MFFIRMVSYRRNMTTSQVAVDLNSPKNPRIASPLQRWALAIASTWMVVGLQFDAWAHANIPDLETFWTPWHAVMYSGIAFCMLAVGWVIWPHLHLDGPWKQLLIELPKSAWISVVGMSLLLLSGGIDTAWHLVFGIENELEIFISPSHTGLILGMVLLPLGPVALRWAEPDTGRLSPADTGLVLLCVLIAALPAHIFTNHATALGFPPVGSGLDPLPLVGQDVSWLHGFALSTVLLVLPIAAWSCRWRVAWGVPTVLVAVPNLFIWITLGGFAWPTYPALFTIAAALAEVVTRTVISRISNSSLPARRASDAFYFAAAALGSALLWGITLAMCAFLLPAGINPDSAVDYLDSLDYDRDGQVDVLRYGWNVHGSSGIVLLVALVGGTTAAIARRVITAPPVD
jgi:hypothetical protein